MNKIQSYEFNILNYINNVCEENNLNYYLASGTALGAIRHKGFIPWDDDIDIMMPRDDFNKFLNIMNDNENERYKLCCVQNNDKWTAPLAKVIDTNTILHQNGHREKMDLGIYVDVFVIDGVPDNKFIRRVHYTRLDLLQKLWGCCEHENRTDESKFKNALKNLISNIVVKIISARTVSKKIVKVASKYDYDKYDEVATIEFVGCDRSKVCMKKESLGNGRIGVFEGLEVKIPEKCEEYLENIYGDYMKLPPEEERISAHDFTVKYID